MSAPLEAQLMADCPAGIVAVDADGILRAHNPAAARLLGRALAPGQPIATTLGALPVRREALAPERQDEPEFSLAVSGRELLVRVCGGPLSGGRQAVLQDVTRLQLADSYRTEFVANVSHELRTPTTSIVGYAETLLEEAERLEPDLLIKIISDPSKNHADC